MRMPRTNESYGAGRTALLLLAGFIKKPPFPVQLIQDAPTSQDNAPGNASSQEKGRQYDDERNSPPQADEVEDIEPGFKIRLIFRRVHESSLWFDENHKENRPKSQLSMEQFSLFTPPNILSVTEFLGSVNLMFSEVGLVKIQGEIDDISLRGSYGFFALKESNGGVKAEASLGCFVGWKCIDKVQHLLQSGMEVVISGYPSIYVKNGSFRIDIVDIQPVGEGALQKAFEALKLKLLQKGYFAPERKRAISPFVKNIGLITSMSGAAVIDFKRNLGAFGFTIEYIDVRVEGETAEESIMRAIKKFNEARPQLDALVLMRGGGSLESLQAFNSEKVADAIYFSRIPVITGIGHEKDNTIADFVADVRCSTPTAVANLLHSYKEELIKQLTALENDLIYTFDGTFSQQKYFLTGQAQKISRSVEFLLQQNNTELRSYEYGLQNGLQYIFNEFHTLEKNFNDAAYEFDCSLRLMKEKTEAFEKQIVSLNPEAILERGYSITYNEKGKVVKSVKGVEQDDILNIRVSDGTIKTKTA